MSTISEIQNEEAEQIVAEKLDSPCKRKCKLFVEVDIIYNN